MFMIGGGSFLELENLHKVGFLFFFFFDNVMFLNFFFQFGKDSGKKVMYGCTEMLTPEGFLRQASEVGRKAK